MGYLSPSSGSNVAPAPAQAPHTLLHDLTEADWLVLQRRLQVSPQQILIARLMFTLDRTHTTAAGLGRLIRATRGKNIGGPVHADCIKKQFKRMCRKLGVHGRTELALRIATEVFGMKALDQ